MGLHKIACYCVAGPVLRCGLAHAVSRRARLLCASAGFGRGVGESALLIAE